ncbi:flagellar hook-length control protein FliK, partial [Kineococcus indalonis]|uniref:flagellar hook-length control protein FliK n=1 Tax=Kineococcus indalonis TaxID=2696566 RepID=UPI0014131A86
VSTPPAPLPLTNPLAFAQGVSARLEQLPAGADAVHRMTVEVNPLGLGPVQVTAEIVDGALSVQLAGASDAARHALRQAVGDLQRELAGTAFTSTTVEVRPDDASTGQRQAGEQAAAGQSGDRSEGRRHSGGGPAGHPARRGLFAADEPRAAQRAAAAAAEGRLDLRV